MFNRREMALIATGLKYGKWNGQDGGIDIVKFRKQSRPTSLHISIHVLQLFKWKQN